jgi:hypothetical protein
MNMHREGMLAQPPLFDLPDPPAPGWHPSDLGTGTQVYWTSPGEIESRLDATYYVISRRPERLLDTLGCSLSPLEEWAAVNPKERRLPAERGYLLYDDCLYAQVGHVPNGCWALGPELPVKEVRELPVRAAYAPQPGDLLLPRVYSSLHRSVTVLGTEKPLVTSSAFALLAPRSRAHGLALLALLHHRVMGEQLWALASGTTVRSVSAGKVHTLQVPQVALELRATLAAKVEELLYAQAMVVFPGLQMPVTEYWQDGTLSQWRRRAQQLSRAIQQAIDQALGVKRKA